MRWMSIESASEEKKFSPRQPNAASNANDKRTYTLRQAERALKTTFLEAKLFSEQFDQYRPFIAMYFAE